MIEPEYGMSLCNHHEILMKTIQNTKVENRLLVHFVPIKKLHIRSFLKNLMFLFNKECLYINSQFFPCFLVLQCCIVLLCPLLESFLFAFYYPLCGNNYVTILCPFRGLRAKERHSSTVGSWVRVLATSVVGSHSNLSIYLSIFHSVSSPCKSVVYKP